jgi:hypothetical protein
LDISSSDGFAARERQYVKKQRKFKQHFILEKFVNMVQCLVIGISVCDKPIGALFTRCHYLFIIREV